MTQTRWNLAALSVAILVSGCTSGWSSNPAAMPGPAAARPSFRVVETATGSTVPFQDVIARAAMADVVFFGEQHDDPETHFAEFALLEGIGRQRRSLILSLEMFERDVQPLLDDYLAGRLSEADFLAKSRPWERYATDYRGLVMLARARGWKVVAANVPRPIATAVSRRGMSALDTLSTTSRAWAAANFLCPSDNYYTRFAEAMSGHSAGGGPPTANDAAAMLAMTQRFYEAQCVKDETMAESIVRALRETQYPASNVPETDGLVVHFNGAFHSDFGLGTAQRVTRRFPGVRRLIITAVPVPDPSMGSMREHSGRADYVIFTRAAEKKPGG